MLQLSQMNKSLNRQSSDTSESESEEEQEKPSPLKRRNKSFVAKDHEDPHADPESSEDTEEDIEDSRRWGWAKKKKNIKKSEFIDETYSAESDEDVERVPKVKIQRQRRESDFDKRNSKMRKQTPDKSWSRDKSRNSKGKSSESDDDKQHDTKGKKSKRKPRKRNSSSDDSSPDTERESQGKKNKKLQNPSEVIMILTSFKLAVE